ncbi:MAG: AAA family ATPase [Candidatus Omnitrophica bacterium]|nr:AAA family ATPase [Candidatus Omnitrophota bacterium]
MKVISVVNQKGGCGKTITAINLAAGLSKNKQRVLLIDLDPQGHASDALGVCSKQSITDLLEKQAAKTDISKEESLTANVVENLDIITSSIGLASLEQKLSDDPNKLKILSSLTAENFSAYDYVIIDCPPNLGLLTINALVASDYSLIPIQICNFSLKGVDILKNILLMIKDFQGKTPTPFHLLSQVDKRSRYAKQFIENLQIQLGSLLLLSTIRNNVHLKEAAAHGINIFDYKPESRGAEDFRTLTKEIEKLTAQKTWASLFLRGEELEEVYVVGDFNDWEKKDRYKLKKGSGDIWGINIPLDKGEYRYKFVSQDNWFSDPHNAVSESDSFGGTNSILKIK